MLKSCSRSPNGRIFFKRFFLLAILIGCFLSVNRPALSILLDDLEGINPPDEKKKREQLLLDGYIESLPGMPEGPVDVKIKIAENLKKLTAGEIDAATFYRELAVMELPAGRQKRDILQEVKKDIENYAGQKGLTEFLGPVFDGKAGRLTGGGTVAERSALVFRQKKTLEGIDYAIKKLAPEIKARGLTVYMAEVGSWSTENPQEMKFAGDIDFSFLCGDLEISEKLKDAFGEFIEQEVQMSPEEFDTPCTPHGMADFEVFIGKHGQLFAEGMMKIVREVDLDKGTLGAEADPKAALRQAIFEGKTARMPLMDLEDMKWPKEPGISLEMVRHFERDIVGKNVHTDVDCFIKAAKYATRSIGALEGIGLQPANPALAQFLKDLIAAKKKPGTDVAKLIEDYFKAINQPLPMDVKLGPFNARGQSQVQLEIKEAFIQDFWKSCSDLMWDNAQKGFRKVMADAQAKIRALPPPPAQDQGIDDQVMAEAERIKGEVEKVAAELEPVREMMEVEMRVLGDPNEGVRKIPDELGRMMAEFRTEYTGYKQKYCLSIEPIEINKGYKFIEEQLKAKQPNNLRMAGAFLLNAPYQINNYLDLIDDSLMGELRGETSVPFSEYLSKTKELTWARKVDKFLKRTSPAESEWVTHVSAAEKHVRVIEMKVNETIFNNFASRKIKDVNNFFSRSFMSSTGGQVTLKAMVTFNVINEIPVYADLFWKGNWPELAGEFVRRRIPFGSAAEKFYMGEYLGGCWGTVVTFVPPTALFQPAL
ncbi:MAG: hypothetical protein PHN49_07480, partial [Candidatus Omnitrophica bacterium]|nr:hypothetical protein [Candidatus Omnitrophota bacterium]